MSRHPGGRTCNGILTAPIVALVVLASWLVNLGHGPNNEPPPFGSGEPVEPPHDTCVDVSTIGEGRGSAWRCGPECPKTTGWPVAQRGADLVEGRPERRLQ